VRLQDLRIEDSEFQHSCLEDFRLLPVAFFKDSEVQYSEWRRVTALGPLEGVLSGYTVGLIFVSVRRNKRHHTQTCVYKDNAEEDFLSSSLSELSQAQVDR